MDTPILHCLFIQYSTLSPENEELFFSLLPENEKLKLASFQPDTKRAEFLVSRCAVQALGKLAGFDAIHYNPSTPIVLAYNQTVYVSLSHTQSAVAVSLFHTQHGIDIEPCRRHVTYRNTIINRYFTPSEQKYINRFPWGKRNRFLHLWTLKEAIAKLQELSLTQALMYDTPANPDNLLLANFLVLKKYICGIAIGDSYLENVLIRQYTMSSNELARFLCGCGRYRIRTSDLLHVRQAL